MSKYITSTPGIMSGDPVIAGTRVPISRILFLLKEGYTLEAIHEEYPHISTETLSKSTPNALYGTFTTISGEI